MSKDARSSQGNAISTPSKKSVGKHNKKIGGGNGSADKRPTTPDSNSKERKSSARSKKQMKDHKEKDKEHHHKKKDGIVTPKKSDDKKESEKEKRQSDSKQPVKKEKQQNSQLPTEFEEVNVARRPAVSKTKRKHLIVGGEEVTPPGTPIPTTPGQSSHNITSGTPESIPIDEGLPTPQDAGKGTGGGSADPDSSGRMHGEVARTPESDTPGPIPGIKLSKELIKPGSKELIRHGSKENVRSSNKEKPKPGSKEMVKSDVPKTVIGGTPGIIQNIAMLPPEEDEHEKKE